MKALNREKVKAAITGSVRRVYSAQTANLDLYRNTLDCFSSAIDSLVQGITLDDWMIQEKDRQVQKTKQNAIGSLHEDVLGSIDGVRLAVGEIIDIISDEKKLVAEIKNKHNTTKGNHKVSIYHDLAHSIAGHPGYTGYYVEILPAGARAYNNPFQPSDNQTGSRLPAREDIRIIDGKSFYALLTGSDDALFEFYEALPGLVSEIIREEFGDVLDSNNVIDSESFLFNFEKAYGAIT